VQQNGKNFCDASVRLAISCSTIVLSTLNGAITHMMTNLVGGNAGLFSFGKPTDGRPYALLGAAAAPGLV
jgi:hypothetical protein